jgi:uncharacterized protein (DUF58 family)
MDDDHDDELEELLAEVRRIDVQSRRLVLNLLRGRYNAIFRGTGLEFHAVREYADGDDRRLIDPNVSARTGRPFVKTYRDEREKTVMFLMDLSASMAGGFGVFSARQAAARVCACLALTASRNNDKVGFVGFSAGVDRYLPAKRGVGHVLRIVRDCLALPGGSPRSAPGLALEFAARVLRRRSIVFLLSDFLAEGWQESLSLCARRHDLIAIRILSPELTSDGAASPADGLLHVRDPETAREAVVDFGSSRVRAAFNERVAAWRERTAEALRRADVDLMDVPLSRTPDKDMIARPIIRFLRMREERGARPPFSPGGRSVQAHPVRQAALRRTDDLLLPDSLS